MEKTTIDIRPTTGVYATYKNLTYKPWTALAEFIDNSTQSYFDHKKELDSLKDFKKCFVEIEYTQDCTGEDTLVIKDNAYGMEQEDFFRAIALDKPPQKITGRNEFGMGLKTAACWFGKFWTVTSTRLNSDVEYSASVDVEELSKTKASTISEIKRKVDKKLHYTIIKIQNLNKKIVGGMTVKKIKEFIGSIYRQDIKDGNIQILYNGEILSYEGPKVYVDKKRKKWKQEIEPFYIEHKGEKLKTYGFVGIMAEGSTKHSGFTLMRRGRVIIGGAESNYKPQELVGSQNSLSAQRIFGELHMDNWPVTQAKDGFDWNDEGLEEKFIEALKPLIKDIKNEASKTRRDSIDTRKLIVKAVKELESAGVVDATDVTFIENKDSGNKPTETESCVPSETKIVKDGKYYIIKMEYKDSLVNWLTVHKSEKDGQRYYDVSLNLNHPFFLNLNVTEEQQIRLTNFVLCMVIAEVELDLTKSKSGIQPDSIRIKLNELLKQYSKGFKDDGEN